MYSVSLSLFSFSLSTYNVEVDKLIPWSIIIRYFISCCVNSTVKFPTETASGTNLEM